MKQRLVRGLMTRLRSASIDPFAAFRSVESGLVTVPPVVHDPDRDARPHLVVLLPTLESARLTGGPNTAINLATRVAASGIPVRFVATGGRVDRDPDALRRHAAMLTGLDTGAGQLAHEALADTGGALRVGRGDRLLATWWPTAHLAHAALALTEASDFYYLIQDFEPGFYGWSTNHAMALQTYRFPIRPIYNESLLRDHFVAAGLEPPDALDHGRSAVFEPAVDRAVFRHGPRGTPRTLLFYARPRNPRNAFELGLRSLRDAVAANAFADEEWRFLAIGDQVPRLPLGRGLDLEPAPWLSFERYGELLGRSDLLLSLMLSPHTSYPPLEMASAGGTVVTNTFGPKTAAALAALSPRLVGVEPDPTSLSGALVQAAVGSARPSSTGVPDASPGQTGADRAPSPGVVGDSGSLALPGTWAEALGPVVSWMVASLRS